MDNTMKKYTVFTYTDINYFNVYEAYDQHNINFFVEVEDTGMVYYPVFDSKIQDLIIFRGWQ